MTGIAEVAQAVGLSTATVSRALRGLPGVSPQTRARIEAAAAELNYAPSRAAMQLATGHTHDVAVVVPYLTRWYFTAVTHGIEEVLTHHDYDMMLYHLRGERESRRRALRTPYFSKRVDGILLIGLEPSEPEREWLDAHAPPVTLVGSHVPGWAGVSIDDHGAATRAMEHLVGLGHRRIAYLGLGQDQYEFSTPQLRLRGYREQMARIEESVPPEWEMSSDFSIAGAERVVRPVLDAADRPTAVFCASDEAAFGVLRVARELGLRVPEHLSVIGVDDHEMSEYLGLTTIAQPVNDLGRLAAEQLLGRLRPDRSPHDGPRHSVLPTRLVVRATTAPPG